MSGFHMILHAGNGGRDSLVRPGTLHASRWRGPDVGGQNLFFSLRFEPDSARGTDRGRAVRPWPAAHAWFDEAQ
mgnify:CR=1 FL=1